MNGNTVNTIEAGEPSQLDADSVCGGGKLRGMLLRCGTESHCY